ncbi:DMT family transporter [Patescibacteria group bacterium]|nr:DMT family transporter [Patescibacteria group bacterium]
MNISDQRIGEFCIVMGVLLWGIFPVFTQLSYRSLSPLTSLAGSSLCAATFFGIVLTVRHRWHELKSKETLRYALLSTVFTGIIFYSLYFLSLKYSSAGNISILGLSEAFFSFMLFQVWKKEFIPKEHIFGAILILLGAIVVLLPSVGVFRLGDILILIAAAIVPFGNYYLQKARKHANAESVLFIRTLVGGTAILFLSFLFHTASPLTDIMHSLSFLLVNGLVVLGISNMLWVEGIHRIPVTKANGLNALGPLVTLLAAWVVFKTAPTAWQLIAFIPMFFGMGYIGKKISLTGAERK